MAELPATSTQGTGLKEYCQLTYWLYSFPQSKAGFSISIWGIKNTWFYWKWNGTSSIKANEDPAAKGLTWCHNTLLYQEHLAWAVSTVKLVEISLKLECTPTLIASFPYSSGMSFGCCGNTLHKSAAFCKMLTIPAGNSSKLLQLMLPHWHVWGWVFWLRYSTVQPWANGKLSLVIV